MTIYYYIVFTIFTGIAYMMIVDKNVLTYIELIFGYSIVQIKRAWWIVRFHPNNPIPRWTLNWRIERMTKKLEKELDVKYKNDTEQ